MERQFFFERIRTIHTQEQFKLLCFRMGVDYEDLEGSGLTVKAQELVTYLEQRGRLAELFIDCKRNFPSRSLLPYFYELIAERFLDQSSELEQLIAGLQLDPARLGEPIAGKGSAHWTRLKAYHLQACMAQTGRWPELRQAFAPYSQSLTPQQIGELFASDEKPLPAAQPAPAAAPSTAAFAPFLQLDYVPQTGHFLKNRKAAIAAYILYGLHGSRADNSLRLLLKRLLNFLPPSTALAKVAPADTAALEYDADAVWEEIAPKVGINKENLSYPVTADQQAEIIKRVAQRLQTSHFILIIEAVNDKMVKLLLAKFWQPFAQGLEAQLKQAAEGKATRQALVFLVDNLGQLSDEVIASAAAQAFTPIALPRLQPFTRAHFEQWSQIALGYEELDEALKTLFFQPDWDKAILEEAEEVAPERALITLCRVCKYDREGFSNWLKH